jgi:hypothetical protein
MRLSARDGVACCVAVSMVLPTLYRNIGLRAHLLREHLRCTLPRDPVEVRPPAETRPPRVPFPPPPLGRPLPRPVGVVFAACFAMCVMLLCL